MSVWSKRLKTVAPAAIAIAFVAACLVGLRAIEIRTDGPFKVVATTGYADITSFSNIVLRTAAIGLLPGGPTTFNERFVVVRDAIPILDDVQTNLFSIVLPATNTTVGGMFCYSTVFKKDAAGIQNVSGIVTFSAVNLDGVSTHEAISETSKLEAASPAIGLSGNWYISSTGTEKRTVTIATKWNSTLNVGGNVMLEVFLRSDAVGSTLVAP